MHTTATVLTIITEVVCKSLYDIAWISVGAVI